MYNKINKLNDTQFRRKTGVRKDTFNKMVEIVTLAEGTRKKLSGRPQKLSYEDQVLMSLTYLREYCTYFSLGHSFDLSESNCFKTIRKIENILIKSQEFRLPNKKDIYGDEDIETVVVDAVESSIEKPKKSKENTTPVRKRSIPLKHK